MIEVELKIFVKNITSLEEQLLKKGFTEGNSLKESDYYLDDESGSIRNHDQALRIRCSQDLSSGVVTNTITYKGPKLDTVSMTRNELEIHTDNLETAIEIFSSLGYKTIYPVIKQREYLQEIKDRTDREKESLSKIQKRADGTDETEWNFQQNSSWTKGN